MGMQRVLALGAMGMLLGCGGGDTATLSSKGAYQELFWSYCLPMAEIMTTLAGLTSSTVASEPIDCPDGGFATYDSDTGEVVLTNCAGVGAVANGNFRLSTLESNQAIITSGQLDIAGDYEGSVTINSGVMNWQLPVRDETLYWELRIVLGGEEVCIWSGAELGDCPAPF